MEASGPTVQPFLSGAMIWVGTVDPAEKDSSGQRTTRIMALATGNCTLGLDLV